MDLLFEKPWWWQNSKLWLKFSEPLNSVPCTVLTTSQADFDLQQFFEGRYYYSHFSDEGNVEILNDLPKQVHDRAGIKCQDSWPQGFGAIRIELS